MKKKLVLIISIFLILFMVSGCATKEGKEFKKEYEALNGKTNASGKEHRTVTIDKKNPYIKVDASEIVKKIENKETFYVYFGDEMCPWCRSVIEKSIEIAKSKKIDKIYYVKIWDKDGNEVVRNKYVVNEDNEIEETIQGSEAYVKLLEYFDSLLSDYKVSDSEGNEYEVGEKRIYAPNYIYVEKGEPKKLVEGISEKQTDSRGELTEEILKDEETIFNKFFSN